MDERRSIPAPTRSDEMALSGAGRPRDDSLTRKRRSDEKSIKYSEMMGVKSHRRDREKDDQRRSCRRDDDDERRRSRHQERVSRSRRHDDGDKTRTSRGLVATKTTIDIARGVSLITQHPPSRRGDTPKRGQLNRALRSQRIHPLSTLVEPFYVEIPILLV